MASLKTNEQKIEYVNSMQKYYKTFDTTELIRILNCHKEMRRTTEIKLRMIALKGILKTRKVEI